MQKQKSVSAYFTFKHMLLFAFYYTLKSTHLFNTKSVEKTPIDGITMLLMGSHFLSKHETLSRGRFNAGPAFATTLTDIDSTILALLAQTLW